MADTPEKETSGRQTPETYEEAAAYIGDLPRFTRKHPLSHTREFLRRLGDPAADKKILHVAGTNGKGSVCAMLQAILAAEGKRTGLFISPHLVRMNERIRLDGEPIGDDLFYRVFCRVQPVAAAMEAEGLEHPTYFEFLYACAICAFAETDEEYLILETGLGGRLDATNVNEHPLLTVITSISPDHTRYLGNTTREIAAEKAGIIKPGVPLVFDGDDPASAEVIRKKADEMQAPCRKLTVADFRIEGTRRNEITFSRLHSDDENGRTWKIPSCGLYQVINAGLALAAAEEIFGGSWSLQEEAAHKDRWAAALASLTWEGRMEQVRPHLTLDGAHNPGAVKAFTETVLQRDFPGGTVSLPPESAWPVVLFSAVEDKPYGDMIAALCDGFPAQAYIVTEIEDDRKVPAETLAEIFRQKSPRPVYCIPDLREALDTAFSIRGTGELYAVGSLYLIGMIKNFYNKG